MAADQYPFRESGPVGVQEGKADAVAMADVLHYNRFSMPQIRAAAQAAHIPVRLP